MSSLGAREGSGDHPSPPSSRPHSLAAWMALTRGTRHRYPSRLGRCGQMETHHRHPVFPASQGLRPPDWFTAHLRPPRCRYTLPISLSRPSQKASSSEKASLLLSKERRLCVRCPPAPCGEITMDRPHISPGEAQTQSRCGNRGRGQSRAL